MHAKALSSYRGSTIQYRACKASSRPVSYPHIDVYKRQVEYGGGAGSAILNVLWFVFGGVFLALEALLNGVLLCITVIGIPFGLQCFKQAKLALLPFGAVVRGK